jgi:hypothetical protein
MMTFSEYEIGSWALGCSLMPFVRLLSFSRPQARNSSTVAASSASASDPFYAEPDSFSVPNSRSREYDAGRVVLACFMGRSGGTEAESFDRDVSARDRFESSGAERFLGSSLLSFDSRCLTLFE